MIGGMTHDRYSDDYIRAILKETHRIAVVGASDRPERPSFGVVGFLKSHGYAVVPVNPNLAGDKIMGEAVYPDLAAVPGAIDMVDIFRRSDAVAPVVDDAITKGVKFIWMQLGVRDDAAAAKAEAAGIRVVMNRCPAIEYPRLMRGR
jgi:predicted CoA-binding protein